MDLGCKKKCRNQKNIKLGYKKIDLVNRKKLVKIIKKI